MFRSQCAEESATRTTRRARIIAVAGGKGGVGKTTIAVNLGFVFAQNGATTILVDADFCLSGIRVLTRVAPAGDLGDVLTGRSIEELLSHASTGLSVIGGLPASRRDTDSAWSSALKRLSDVCDTIIIDGGSGIGDPVLDSALAADLLILPTTPEPTSVADSYAFLKLMARAGYNGSIGVTATMAQGDAQAAEVALRIRQVARQFLGLDVADLGGVPRDAHVSRAVQQRAGVVTLFPHCPASRALHALARRIDPRRPSGPPAGIMPRIAALFL